MSIMTPDQFYYWRTSMRMTKAEAAKALGLSPQTLSMYEVGYRADINKPVPIPKAVELACAALAYGITKYDGPDVNLLPSLPGTVPPAAGASAPASPGTPSPKQP